MAAALLGTSYVLGHLGVISLQSPEAPFVREVTGSGRGSGSGCASARRGPQMAVGTSGRGRGLQMNFLGFTSTVTSRVCTGGFHLIISPGDSDPGDSDKSLRERWS